MRPRLYLDSSAYLAILLGEQPAPELEERIVGAELLSSVLLLLESHRALVRLSRERRILPGRQHEALDRLREDAEVFTLADVTIDLCRSTTYPAVSVPRSLDLAHLRTAAWFHGMQPLTAFLSLDQPQLRAARDLGLPT